MKYNLNHLTQDFDQQVLGPIQDDEALLLYSIIRVMRLHNIVEIGGLAGYSATNFICSVIQGNVYTVDINFVNKLADNHIPIIKDCKLITKMDLPNKIDMIFFDSHCYEDQLKFFDVLEENNIIDDEIVLAFHDTNLHPEKLTPFSYFIESEGGWCHQSAERKLVEHFKQKGFDALSFHTKLNENTIRFRHGITVMKKYKKLKT